MGVPSCLCDRVSSHIVSSSRYGVIRAFNNTWLGFRNLIYLHYLQSSFDFGFLSFRSMYVVIPNNAGYRKW